MSDAARQGAAKSAPLPPFQATQKVGGYTFKMEGSPQLKAVQATLLKVTVTEAYLHCAKALLRSKLWQDDYKVDRDALPSYAQMLKDQVPSMQETAGELEQVIAKSYATTLY